eukprot:gnl/MRDRNA2_/MRDRNA2_37266_c0_seq2.p1 gnl/MRDRNA2_/MRDRNA2_37266_c0~~gnl/MRDRNA2_/MRDRNA2_37266_c0_seq2.p1  ORF type:complete len:248 (+),score=34.20 gnl/MRDRNA2_/MRDRNA2_37266_c0_seq2:1-744(+)
MNGVLCDALKIGGAFHVGVEVFGVEWSFGHDGVVYSSARRHDVHVYRQSIPLGNTRLDPEDVDGIVGDMASGAWRGETYDILCRNCCTFARELCFRLLQGRDRIPGWIDRLGNGLAGVLGPVGMTGTVAPAPPRTKSFYHVRQDSDDFHQTQISICEGEESEAQQTGEKTSDTFTGHSLRQTQSFHHYPLMTSQSFGRLPVHQEVRAESSSVLIPSMSFSLHTYPAHVCRAGPPITTGVVRRVSAVY